MSGYIGPKTSDVPIGTISTKGTVSANSIVVGTNNVTIGNAVYVASNGNVGVGTGTPSYKLQVSDTIYVAGELQSNTTTPGVRLFSGGSEKGKVSANSTGYLLFDTVGSQRMCIDSNGNTTIGSSTTSNGRLQVENNGTNFVWARNSAAGAGISGFVCQNSGDTRGIRIDGGNFQVYDHSAGAVRIQIDGSGRITTPYQPAGSVSWSGTLTRGNIIPFATANQERFTLWNTSTYRLTAPVAGYYLFTCIGRTAGTGGIDFNIQLLHNGSSVVESWAYDNSGGKAFGASLSHIRYLAASDYVQFYFNHDSGSPAALATAWASYALLG